MVHLLRFIAVAVVMTVYYCAITVQSSSLWKRTFMPLRRLARYVLSCLLLTRPYRRFFTRIFFASNSALALFFHPYKNKSCANERELRVLAGPTVAAVPILANLAAFQCLRSTIIFSPLTFPSQNNTYEHLQHPLFKQWFHRSAMSFLVYRTSPVIRCAILPA